MLAGALGLLSMVKQACGHVVSSPQPHSGYLFSQLSMWLLRTGWHAQLGSFTTQQSVVCWWLNGWLGARGVVMLGCAPSFQHQGVAKNFVCM